MATAALVCGIVGLVLFFLFVPSVVALVLGLIAASRAKQAPGPDTGLGRARAGWIMGAIGVAGFVALIVGAALTDGFETTTSPSIASTSATASTSPRWPDRPTSSRSCPRRDCDEPHDAEVYLVDDVAIDSDEYPGDAALAAEIEDLCTGAAFEDYTGGSFADSSSRLLLPVPDRGVVGLRRPGLHVHGRQRRRLAAATIRSRGSGD